MRILMAVHNAYTDPTSGAARSMRTLMSWLAAAGHSCRVLATTRSDGVQSGSIASQLAPLGIAPVFPPLPHHLGTPCPVHEFILQKVLVWTLETEHHPLSQPCAGQPRQFIELVELLFEQFEPHVLLTYGGHLVIQQALRSARRRGIKTVLSLRSHGYEDPRWFADVDRVLTCSPYLSRCYRDAIGLASQSIEPPIDWSETMAEADRRRYVTFVNPTLAKGAAMFARIVDVLADRRPDIPFLVVQGTGDGRAFGEFQDVDISRRAQVMLGPPAPYPRDFLGLTKLLLVPSVFPEPFGRVAVEAMINGIPVLVSDRGALPATVRGAGYVLPIPPDLAPLSRTPPTVEQAAPWCDAIEALWDDEARYAALGSLGRVTAERFYAEDDLRQRYLQYFESL